MMGKKKLTTIRRELRERFAVNGQDSIQWIEDQIRHSKSKRDNPQNSVEVLESLLKVLKAKPPKRQAKHPRVKAN
jgi:hypothetical protein